MKIVLIGATGFVGNAVMKEALYRGNEVTVIVRDPGKLSPQKNLKIVQGDVFDTIIWQNC